MFLLFRFRWLRTTSNIIIGSMVITDILAGVVAIVNSLQGLNVLNGASYVACVVYTTIDFCITTASSLHVVTASIERYIAIQYPLHHVAICTKTNIIRGLAFVWFVSICFSLLSLMGNYNDVCLIISVSHPLIAVIMVIVIYHVPLVLFCGLFARISCTVIKQRKSISESNTTAQDSNQKAQTSQGTRMENNQGNKRILTPATKQTETKASSNLKPFILISSIILAYVLFWCPYTICVSIHQIRIYSQSENMTLANYSDVIF